MKETTLPTPPPFLLCRNDRAKEVHDYVLHTKTPKFLASVTIHESSDEIKDLIEDEFNSNLGFQLKNGKYVHFRIVNKFDIVVNENDWMAALARAQKWYYGILLEKLREENGKLSERHLSKQDAANFIKVIMEATSKPQYAKIPIPDNKPFNITGRTGGPIRITFGELKALAEMQ